MNGKIYTSYFAKIKQGRGMKISVARYNPKWLNAFDISYRMYSLAPSHKLLRDYKNGLGWEVYKERYTNEIKGSERAIEDIKEIIEIIRNNIDVTLYCYEKPEDNCHRHLLAEFFNIMGFETEEIK